MLCLFSKKFSNANISLNYQKIKSDILISFPKLHFQYRMSLIFHFAVIDIKVKFNNTYLGFLWSAMEPMMYFIVLYVVFSTIRGSSGDYAIYLITGVMIYHIFVKGTYEGLASLTSNVGILQSLNIKRDFFPIVATTSTGILAFVDIGVFFALMPVFHFVPTWTIILLPIPLILTLILVLGLSYFLSIVSILVPDIRYIWSILIHALLFASPIFWKTDEASGILLQIQKINPVGQLIELSHKVVIDGEVPPLSDWLYTTLFVLGIFVAGYVVFHKLQDKIMEDL